MWPPVSGVPHAKVAYVSYLPVQKKGRVIVMLTEGLWWPELLRRAAGVEDGRRRRRSSVTEMTQRCCRGRSRGQRLGEAPGGLGGVEALRGRDSSAAEERGRGGAAPCSARRSCAAWRLGIGAAREVERGQRVSVGFKGGVRRSRGGAPRESPARNAAVIRDRILIRSRAGF